MEGYSLNNLLPPRPICHSLVQIPSAGRGPMSLKGEVTDCTYLKVQLFNSVTKGHLRIGTV